MTSEIIYFYFKNKTHQTTQKTELGVPRPRITPLLSPQKLQAGHPVVPRVCSAAAPPRLLGSIARARCGQKRTRTACSHMMGYVTIGAALCPAPSW